MRHIDPHRSGYIAPDKRVAPRTDCYTRLPVIMPDLLQQIVTIINISADGVLFRHDRALSEGDCVSIKFPIIGPVNGYVAWSAGGQSGIQFDMSILPQDYIPLLRTMGIRTGDQ